MSTFTEHSPTRFEPSVNGIFILILLAAFAGTAFAQSTASVQDKGVTPAASREASSPAKPLVSIYKDVTIGMAADEVRSLLGKAKIDDDDGFFYDRDTEMIQIRLDKDKNVRLIAVTYSHESPEVPKYSDIFGKEPTDAKPDGSIYTLVRYPESGYWIAYSKTGGDKPGVIVTMQKL